MTVLSAWHSAPPAAGVQCRPWNCVSPKAQRNAAERLLDTATAAGAAPLSGCLTKNIEREAPEINPTFALDKPASELAHLLADLADGLLLQLADALARQVVLIADLFERELVLVIETEAPADNPRLDRSQGTE
jgi:hypothetical protein